MSSFSIGDTETKGKKRGMTKAKAGVIAIAVAAVAAMCVTAYVMAGKAPVGERRQAYAENEGSVQVDPETVSDDAGELTGLTDADFAAVKTPYKVVAGVSPTLESARIGTAADGRRWLEAVFMLQPASDAEGDFERDGVRLIASQGDVPLTWDTQALADWDSTHINGKGVERRVLLRLDGEGDADIAMMAGEASMGWTVKTGEE